MLIGVYYNALEIHRENRIIYAKFLRPHQVISTCRAAGGVQTGLTYIYNHQSCEPSGHHKRLSHEIYRNAEAYRMHTSEPYGLQPEACATLGTAANMRHAAFRHDVFNDLEVIAVCTGGVESNAGRAGDPASVYESPEGFETVPPGGEAPGPGTINTMIFINKPLIPGALVRCIMTATEAKTAALQELAVNSRYSNGPATGTGTDQIAVSALIDHDVAPFTSAGKHVKLGELIGRCVHDAVTETLARQNSLTPSGQCSAKIHLERFGVDRKGMADQICSHLPEEEADILRKNFKGIEKDPVTVASVASITHLKDKFLWKILPETCHKEIMGTHAALIACAVSGHYRQMSQYRELLSQDAAAADDAGFVSLVCRAMALGFQDKWK